MFQKPLINQKKKIFSSKIYPVKQMIEKMKMFQKQKKASDEKLLPKEEKIKTFINLLKAK